jgi:MFS transporter, DHA2 family, multidrug resistance protein
MNVTAPTAACTYSVRTVSAAPPAIHLSTSRKALAFAIMCLGCFVAYLDIQIVSASIQEIGGGLSASQDELSWIQSSYLIAEIIVIPLSAWLSRVMSTRWLIAASAVGCTLTSVLCSTAWDMRSLIVFRGLQGFFGGAMIPTAFTAAVILFQGKQKAVAASFVSGVAGLAPTLGPVLGGWLTDSWSWHWLFYVNIVPGMLVMLLVPILVKVDEPDPTLLRDGDYLGMILMALFLGCLDYVLEERARWEWFADDTIKVCAAISGLAGIGFIIRSLTTRSSICARSPAATSASAACSRL